MLCHLPEVYIINQYPHQMPPDVTNRIRRRLRGAQRTSMYRNLVHCRLLMSTKLLRKLCDCFIQSALGLPPYVHDTWLAMPNWVQLQACLIWYLRFSCGHTTFLFYQCCGKHPNSLQENTRCHQSAYTQTGYNWQHLVESPNICDFCKTFKPPTSPCGYSGWCPPQKDFVWPLIGRFSDGAGYVAIFLGFVWLVFGQVLGLHFYSKGWWNNGRQSLFTFAFGSSSGTSSWRVY